MKKFFILLIIPFLAVACKDDKDDSNPPSEVPTPKNTIQLNDLQEGQVNRYLRYTADCSDPEGSFAFTGDTLVVEMRQTTEGLTFHEEFTPGSTEMGGLEPSQTLVISEDGFILIPERQLSYLFFFYGNDTIFLEKPEDLNLNQGECFIEYANGDPFIGEEIGFLPDFTYGSIRHQNNRIVSCVPPILNLDAYLVYTNEELKMSHTLTNNFTSYLIDGYTLLK
jgi:hypothetical protein